MLVSFFKKIVDDYKFLPELLTIATALMLVFGRIRGWTWTLLKGFYTWFIFPFKSQDVRREILTEISSLKVELKKNTDISEKTAKDVATLKEIVGHNGGGGLLDMVGVLAGFQSSDFWLRAQPGFICDEEGRNLDITHAYGILLGVSTKADLSGISWKSYTDSGKSNTYLNEFKDCASHRESFRGKLDLYDVNAVSKGSWIVVAHPISAEKAKAKRYIGFLYPASEDAKTIAKAYNWPMSVPI